MEKENEEKNEKNINNEEKNEKIGKLHFSILEFDLIKDIKKHIVERWKHMLLITVVCVFFICIYLFFLNINTSSLNIAFRYSAIGKGMNPDGTRFNIYEILSDDVLENVVQKLNNEKITVKYLRNHLVIQDRMAGKAQQQVEKSVMDGYENYTLLPSEYTISYSQPIGPLGAKKILDTVSEVYSEYFLNHHMKQTTVLKPNLDDIFDIDYINGIDKIKIDLLSMQGYLTKRQEENIKFVSSETGKSFGDLSSMIDSILNVDMDTYKSYLIKSSLTKNRSQLITQYRYAVKKCDTDYKQENAEYLTNMEGLSFYDQTVTKVVFIPTIGDDSEYYMSRTNTGIDFLTENAAASLKKMGDISLKTNEYNYLMASFTEGENVSSDVSVADGMLQSLLRRIEEISDLAIKTEDEYVETKEKSKPTFKAVQFGLDVSSNLRYIMIGAVFSAIASFIVVMGIEKIIKMLRSISERSEDDDEQEGVE